MVLSVTFLRVGEFAISKDAESWAPWREVRDTQHFLNAGNQRTLLMNCLLSCQMRDELVGGYALAYVNG